MNQMSAFWASEKMVEHRVMLKEDHEFKSWGVYWMQTMWKTMEEMP